jgi:hypothetical protein
MRRILRTGKSKSNDEIQGPSPFDFAQGQDDDVKDNGNVSAGFLELYAVFADDGEYG